MAKTIKQGPPVQFRSAELGQQLQARGEANQVAKRDLARYYRAMAEELARAKFTEAEAALLCEANRGLAEEHDTIRLWVNVADADDLAQKWHVDAEALAGRLRAMPPAQQLAIRDAVERYWAAPGEDRGRRLVEIGLMDPRALRLKEADRRLMEARRAFRIAEAAGKNIGTKKLALDQAQAELEAAEVALLGRRLGGDVG